MKRLLQTLEDGEHILPLRSTLGKAASMSSVEPSRAGFIGWIEELNSQVGERLVIDGAEMRDRSEQGKPSVAKVIDGGDRGRILRRLGALRKLRKEQCGGIKPGKPPSRKALSTQAKHRVMSNLRPVLNEVWHDRVSHEVQKAIPFHQSKRCKEGDCRSIEFHSIPVAIEDKAGKGCVPFENMVNRLPDGRHRRVVKRCARVAGREPSRFHHLIPRIDRNVEHFTEMHDHLDARARTTGFQKRDMARADVGLHGETKLAQAPLPTPFLQ